ncbi:PHP domain protein [[Leptolyngbya] sp. PCC 7376]|uniref:DUF6282 family protein n=1 Tax=[Leptolyngbya] sp. PCC 7376 TaxID=111781 RepID=UPI00029F0B90|nr:DUF6282 family protein [[Leptolyngbya] sp. PCC 7376]AFY40681.1 PHP domain protein [[Leptolyngbya] sp. PCC 7376]
MRSRFQSIFVVFLQIFGYVAIAYGLCFGNYAAAATLEGAVEFHVHSAPDVRERLYDDIELVQEAAKAKMQAIVLKNHVTSTADRAILTHKTVPSIEVYGGIVLNEAVGGINPKAVEVMAKLGEGRGKIVWLPTIDAAYHRKTFNTGKGGLRVTRGDRLLSQTKSILEFIAENNLVLGTGDVSPKEVLVVVHGAKQLGVEKILVTHAMATVPGLTLEQMQILADQGAFLEITYSNTLAGKNADEADHDAWENVPFDAMVTAIKTIGAEHFVLSTDLGRSQAPSPIEGYQAFLDQLETAGISETDLQLMSHTNPLNLLS